MTGQKDHPRHGEILKRILTDPTKNNQILAANDPAAGGLHPQAAASLIQGGLHPATTNLPVKAIRARQTGKRAKNARIPHNAANLTQAGRQIRRAGPNGKAIRARQTVKHVKNAHILHHAANPIQDVLLTVKTNLKEKAIHARQTVKHVKNGHIHHHAVNPILDVRQTVKTNPNAKAIHARQMAKRAKNARIHQNAANPIQDVLLMVKINRKGNLRPIAVNVKAAKENSVPMARAVHAPHPATENSQESVQIILRINHSVQKGLQTGKPIQMPKRLQKPCAAVRKRKLRTMA